MNMHVILHLYTQSKSEKKCNLGIHFYILNSSTQGVEGALLSSVSLYVRVNKCLLVFKTRFLGDNILINLLVTLIPFLDQLL